MKRNRQRKVKKQNTLDYRRDTPVVQVQNQSTDHPENSALIYVGGIAGYDEQRNPRITLHQFLQKTQWSKHNSRCPQCALGETLNALRLELHYYQFCALPEAFEGILEEQSFYIFRTDTNAVLARGIHGFEAAKSRANELRKSHRLKWDEVRFKAQRGNQSNAGGAGGSGGSTAAALSQKQFGVSRDGKTFTNAHGQTSRVQYSRNYNPSKGRRFRGYTDAQGNYHDID